VRDGDVGQDRTPTGVRSPVARRAIDVSSVDGVRNTYRESINDLRDGDVGQYSILAVNVYLRTHIDMDLNYDIIYQYDRQVKLLRIITLGRRHKKWQGYNFLNLGYTGGLRSGIPYNTIPIP
jgi:hypothetical protein